MKPIKITSEKTLSDKEYVLKLYSFQKPDLEGNLHEQQNEIYYRPDGVTVLMIDEVSQRMIFTKQFRLATYLNGNQTGYLVETCAGALEASESPEKAVMREAKEETGYEIFNIRKIMQGYPSPGGNTEVIHFFIANYNRKENHGEGGGAPGEGEDITLLEMSVAEAEKKLKEGWFIDIKTILLLQHYFLHAKK